MMQDRALKPPSEQIVYKPRKEGSQPVFAQQIWDLVKQGKSINTITRRIKGLQKHHIDKAESHVMEYDRAEYERVIGNPKSSLKIWIDECVSWQIGSVLHRLGMGKIFSVRGQNLNGTKDPELWLKIVNQGVNCIITKDKREGSLHVDRQSSRYTYMQPKDLVLLAKKSRESKLFAAWHQFGSKQKYPLVIVLDQDIRTHKITALLKQHRKAIKQAISDRDKIIYIRLSTNGITKKYTVQNNDEEDLGQYTRATIFETIKQGDYPKQLAEAYDKANKKEIAKHIDNIENRTIAFAKANNYFIDPTLIRFVMMVLYKGYIPQEQGSLKEFKPA